MSLNSGTISRHFEDHDIVSRDRPCGESFAIYARSTLFADSLFQADVILLFRLTNADLVSMPTTTTLAAIQWLR